jgi:acetylornithine deacetylase/succinyl-diaminopimelate desuccinylase family protein
VTEPSVDPAEIETILADLVRIPSPNPPGDEIRVVSHITALLDAAGVAWTADELAPSRPNLHVHLGPREAPALVLNGHSDTMPPGAGWTSDPWQPVVRDGVMTGLGACDMKAGLAAMLGAALALARAATPLTRGLRLDIVVDEEATGEGSRQAAARQPLPAAAVIVEPTRLAIVPVGNGQINVAYTVRGAAGHGSTPELGRNAVAAAARAVVALEEWSRTRTPASHPLIGAESLSIGTITGGMKTSVVPDACRFSVDLRVAPGRDPDVVAAEVDAVVAAALGGLAGITWTRETEIRVPPFLTPTDSPLRAALAAAHRAVVGEQPDVVGMKATTDAAWYAERGVETVVYGAGDLANAHRPDEFVPLAEVVSATRVLVGLARSLAG